jgi:uncharacterized protein with NRDE domain
MGITRTGRFAAVTNVRDPARDAAAGARSRGALVADFLRGDASSAAYAAEVRARGEEWNGFNLLVCDGGELVWTSNRAGEPRRLPPGIYGVSNHLLDTPWPKVARARAAVADALAEARDAAEGWDAGLWEMLADRVVAADDQLPETGVGVERERLLSAPFISGEVYGTRSSTVLTVDRAGHVRLVERSLSPGSAGYGEARHAFRVVAPAPAGRRA